MRRNSVIIAALAVCAASSSGRASAQLGVGSMGATTSMAGTLSGMGSGSSVSPGRVTRGLPPSYRPGSDAAFNSGADFGSGGSGGDASSGGTESANSNPVFPPISSGAASPSGVVTRTVSKPFHWTEMRGADYLRELRRPTVRSNSRARGVRNNPRRPLAKYKVPPRNWLSFYLPQDRYKFTLNIWRYVTIEDDRARYPVRYYYKPNSPAMLALLANPPRGVRRSSRVVGFYSWQDAMIAGYRPDPFSKPEPALRVLELGRLSQSGSAMRYIEAVYAGQVSPSEFVSGLSYAQRVARAVGSRRDTRSQVRPIVAQAVGALLGEGPFPTSVTGSSVRVVRRIRVVTAPPVAAPSASGATANNVTPGMASVSGNANVGSNQVPDGGNRAEEYNRFRSNAAGLRR